MLLLWSLPKAWRGEREWEKAWDKESRRDPVPTSCLNMNYYFSLPWVTILISLQVSHLWCSCMRLLENPLCRSSAMPVSVTGSGKLAAWYVTPHFKVTGKRKIPLWEPHALVSPHKNFVQSEEKVLTAKCLDGKKMGNRCQKRSAPKHTDLTRSKKGVIDNFVSNNRRVRCFQFWLLFTSKWVSFIFTSVAP